MGPDLLANQASKQLAAATGTHRPSLNRLMRALCALDLSSEVSREKFELTRSANVFGAERPTRFITPYS